MTLNFYFSCIDQEKNIIKKKLKKKGEKTFLSSPTFGKNFSYMPKLLYF